MNAGLIVGGVGGALARAGDAVGTSVRFRNTRCRSEFAGATGGQRRSARGSGAARRSAAVSAGPSGELRCVRRSAATAMRASLPRRAPRPAAGRPCG
jgi:hypothetical protein